MSQSPNDLAALRQEYSTRGLRRANLKPNPFDQFQVWFQEALQAELLEPNAMTLATSNAHGRIRTRTVLLKAFDQRGFVFFTNYSSKKAQDLTENAQASLLFPWLPLERQVSISGSVEKISNAESLTYFHSRPRGSQLGAWASDQSTVIPSRPFLEARLEEMKQKFGSAPIPLPDFWGGYRIIPDMLEFWQGSANRLHDRFAYTRQKTDHWLIERLSP
jgi:pyridoxamine 5'-phosphate oxidase